jgi:hypothetical protein
MAELTQLESKLGEVMGLAQAAQEATTKVGKLVDDDQIQSTLKRMRDEAKDTEQQAKETRSEAQEMMKTYLGNGADELEGFEFLNMAEAGELAHVEIVAQLNKKARNPQVKELVDSVMPIQQRHVQDTKQATLTLAAREDPNEAA